MEGTIDRFRIYDGISLKVSARVAQDVSQKIQNLLKQDKNEKEKKYKMLMNTNHNSQASLLKR
jgi:hypothetical protein